MLVAGTRGYGFTIAPLDAVGLPGAAAAPPAASASAPPLAWSVSVVRAGRAFVATGPAWLAVVSARGRGEIVAPVMVHHVLEIVIAIAIGVVLLGVSTGPVRQILGPTILAPLIGTAISRAALTVTATATATAPATPAAPLSGTLVGRARLVASGRRRPPAAILVGRDRPLGGGERFPVPGQFAGRPSRLVGGATAVAGRRRRPSRRYLIAARNTEFRGERIPITRRGRRGRPA